MWARIDLAMMRPVSLGMALVSTLDDPEVGWACGIAVGLGCAVAILDDDDGG